MMSISEKSRYFPATTIPPALLREVQRHCEGGYLYIPRRHGLGLVDRILHWAARGEAPRQIAALVRCSISYVYKVLAVQRVGGLAASADGPEDDAALRSQDRAAQQRDRRIVQLKRHMHALRGEGRAEAMQGNQHAKRHGVYSQRFTPEEQTIMADLRPHFADRFTSDEVETVLGTLIQLQRALAIAHVEAAERLDRRLRRLLRPDLAQRRRPRVRDADTPSPLDWWAEIQRLRPSTATPVPAADADDAL